MDNRVAIGRYINSKSKVLDLFCNEGGFALNAALAGASHITAVDSSADVLKGLVILEPVNLNELTVHDALTQFDDIAILKRPDGQMQAYGIAGAARSAQLVEARPANVLVMIGGRIAPLSALAELTVPPGALDD